MGFDIAFGYSSNYSNYDYSNDFIELTPILKKTGQMWENARTYDFMKIGKDIYPRMFK